MFKGRQQLKAANLTTKCKILFNTGNLRKRPSGYLKTDQAEILYKYQMHDQSKFSKSTKQLGAQNHFLIREMTLYLLEVSKMKTSIPKPTSYISSCNIP